MFKNAPLFRIFVGLYYILNPTAVTVIYRAGKFSPADGTIAAGFCVSRQQVTGWHLDFFVCVYMFTGL